jgi:hypothetical protein
VYARDLWRRKWGGYGAKARKELERETEVKWDIFTARCMDRKTNKANCAIYTLKLSDKSIHEYKM